jgi:hypothetical protein
VRNETGRWLKAMDEKRCLTAKDGDGWGLRVKVGCCSRGRERDEPKAL